MSSAGTAARLSALTAAAATALATACTSSLPAAPDLAATPAPLEADASMGTGLPPPAGDTWSYLYATYFAGMTTPGHCGKNHVCHENCQHNFGCGGDRDTCYCGMLWVGLVDPKNPTRSWIARPNDSMLAWFNAGGTMPQDNPVPNPQAASDILAWLHRGGLDEMLGDAGCAGRFLCQKPVESGAEADAEASADAVAPDGE